METFFTWDSGKARKNIRKHGIFFVAARQAFDDPNQYVVDDRFTDGEQRFHLIGMSRNLLLLLVVFVDRSEPGSEIIHMISARKTNVYEEGIYQGHLS